MFANLDLTLVSGFVLAFSILAYVLLDGMDLGVGILFAAERDEDCRDVMINTIAPVWDGNETWLILGGGGLFAFFPVAYAILMPAVYPLVLTMLLALVFRGVAFEFRFRTRTDGGRRAWDFGLFGGSLVAALTQGMILGTLLQGIRVAEGGRAYGGGWWDWVTPFTLLCGVAVALGYALQGAAWLIWRADGALQRRCVGYARTLGVAVVVMTGAVCLWTPFLTGQFGHRWFDWPGVIGTVAGPVCLAALAVLFWRGLSGTRDAQALLCVQGFFTACFAGLGWSLFPLILPPAMTLWDAAAPRSSQAFLLVGASVLIPTILGYTAFAFWVFRGKVTPGQHYHG